MADGVDWGSIADWVGAIGGVTGAGTAAVFYFMDRKAGKERDAATALILTTNENRIRGHALAITKDAHRAATTFITDPNAHSARVDLVASLNATRASAERLQRLPMTPLSTVLDLSDLLEVITDKRIDSRFGSDILGDAVTNVSKVSRAISIKLTAELELSVGGSNPALETRPDT